MTLPWSCPSAETWQRYHLDPSLKSHAELDSHLSQCPYCRQVLEQIIKEIDNLAFNWRQAARISTYHLFMVAISPDPTAGAGFLAAQGADNFLVPRSAVLSSPGQEIIMRVVLDPYSDETWIYLTAEDQALFQNVLVRPFGGQEYITDDKGRVNLGSCDWPTQEKLVAEVKLPKAIFELTPIADTAGDSQATVLATPAGDQIKVTLNGRGRNRRLEIEVMAMPARLPDTPLKIAVRGSAPTDTRVQQVVSAPVVFDKIDIAEKLEIYLYQ
jgi:hypothetical protein